MVCKITIAANTGKIAKITPANWQEMKVRQLIFIIDKKIRDCSNPKSKKENKRKQ